ncbi:MAG: hypothetical protein ACP6IY_06960 [Promethearchaeia archaeon]
MTENVKGNNQESKIKNEKKEIKSKIKSKKTKKRSFKKLMSALEPREQVIRAVGGGLIGVLSIVAITYILWGIITTTSILYAGNIFDVMSMGNGFNSLMGVWALSFTPLTSLNAINENWVDSWYYYLMPAILAGLFMGITCKRIGTSILGGIFFIFWGITIPIIFVFVLSTLGICDPVIVDSALASLLDEPLKKWNFDNLLSFFQGNIFLTWSIIGTIELAIIVIIIAIVIGGLIQLISK